LKLLQLNNHKIKIKSINRFILNYDYLFFQASNKLSQKNALIKMWSLAKYNIIPDDLEPLIYLSYYVPNLKKYSPINLIVSV